MATRDETARELARLVLQLQVERPMRIWETKLICAVPHPAACWYRMQELARQLLSEPD